jgi:hypothetical protein
MKYLFNSFYILSNYRGRGVSPSPTCWASTLMFKYSLGGAAIPGGRAGGHVWRSSIDDLTKRELTRIYSNRVVSSASLLLNVHFFLFITPKSL